MRINISRRHLMCEAHEIMSVTPYIVNGQEYAVKIPVNIAESSKEKRDKEKRACENETVFTRPFCLDLYFRSCGCFSFLSKFEFSDIAELTEYHGKPDCKGEKICNRSCVQNTHNAKEMRKNQYKPKQEQDLSGQRQESSFIGFSD